AATLIFNSSIPSCLTSSCWIGCFALAHKRRTRSSVSSPESVVRSMQVIARSNHAACHSFFTDRRAVWLCARRSTALVLTRTCSTQSRFSGMPRLDKSDRPPKIARGPLPSFVEEMEGTLLGRWVIPWSVPFSTAILMCSAKPAIHPISRSPDAETPPATQLYGRTHKTERATQHDRATSTRQELFTLTLPNLDAYATRGLLTHKMNLSSVVRLSDLRQKFGLILAISCFLAGLALPASAAKKIIFDTDPGTDDALALMLALTSPELDVRAITVVPGNVTGEMGLENALRMVSLANRCDIAVAAGAKHPLFQKLITAEMWHGKNGLANIELPASKCKVDPRFGPDLIIELVHASPHEITLVPVGPLTNIALAIAK